MIGHEHSDLVAGELPPAVAGGNSHRKPVAVRVVGEDEVSAPLPGQGNGEIERARFLGVGEPHRGKAPIGDRLLGDDGDVGVPRF